MGRSQSTYLCQQCGHRSAKWLGRCPSCQQWNTFVEERAAGPSARGRPRTVREVRAATPITEVALGEVPRVTTGQRELDRVLGGGLVEGALTLISGPPGVGKSTLLLTCAERLAKAGHRTLYVSAEESIAQIRLRAERLGALDDDLFLLAETDLAQILSEIDAVAPAILIVDSVQTVYAPALDAAPGSVSQVREVCAQLMHVAKGTGVSTFVVGHVTKDGAIAGPKTLEHIVDTVLSFEATRGGPYRLLRAQKNRFGSTQELAVFEMRGEGLIEIENPSAFFLSERPQDAPGSIVTACVEGSRPLLVEVQGLCVQTALGTPRRTTLGVDSTRVALLAAVLERRCGLSLAGHDLFVNIAGGASVQEPAVDLPVALAVASSFRNLAIDGDLLAFGEIGLSGEVRAVERVEERLCEAHKLGFNRVLLPLGGADRLAAPKGVALLPVKTLDEAMEAVFDR